MSLYENDEVKSYREVFDYQLIPGDGSTIEDVIAAFDNRELYGAYLTNMRNKREVEDAITKYFGPNLPTKKKPLEKAQGFPFPPKTKQAVDDLIRSFEGKPNLLTYEQDGNSLIFPSSKNSSQQNTVKVVKTVMDNAGIKYKLNQIESLGEIRSQFELNRMQRIAGIKN